MDKDYAQNEIYDCIVVGGGASGLFFAASTDLAKSGRRGLILEKTGKFGTKFLMSGGGRCNITHDGSIKDFISQYGDAGKLIRTVLYKHSNIDLIDFLKSSGIECCSEADGRVFPCSGKASTVLEMLIDKSIANGFEFETNCDVTSISRGANGYWELTVSCDSISDKSNLQNRSQNNLQNRSQNNNQRGNLAKGGIYLGRNIVIATGGSSYSKTGSDGSMFNVLERDLNIKIVPTKPALCPISVSDYPYADLAGLSVDAVIKFGKNRSSGPLLFTHAGLSGPAAINISGDLSVGDKIVINYLPTLCYEEAFKMLQDATIGNKASLSTIIERTFSLPKRFCASVAQRTGTSVKSAARILTEERFTVTDAGNFGNAMVTRGGIALDDVNLRTMELKNSSGIYAIGEALDVDGRTGGYNLQFAYSSARTASDSIALI
ncbi:MAG: NAD(P)/FAD-dependent oxidoreductase [Firmicutes bacterium]|nr:NAD(P)/FAD-dependent oxidoreductase [Bacillota bacterium]